RIITQQREAIDRFEEEAQREREKAEALYAHYDLVDEVIRTVRQARADGHGWDDIADRLAEGADRGIDAAEAVTDVSPAGGTVTIALGDLTVEVDPADGVEHNADRLYRGAKAIEEKRAGAQEALADTEERLSEIKDRREAWDTDEAADGEVADRSGPSPTDWLERPSIPVRQPDHWYEQFRWFHTSDGFLVLGGRDADDNEALVAKYLEKGDRFLHTQARGGPVTLLKATGPSEPTQEVDFPTATLEEAAQFAVTYSSVWKDGAYSGDVYMVEPDQVSKTPESGEYLEKGGFAIRGERTYFRDVAVGCAVGIQCDPETRVIGGPPRPIEEQAVTTARVEPGEFAQGDVAKRVYRAFRERFADTSFGRKVASPDEIGKFLPPGTSRIQSD
ncbi:MAG: ribosome rescue protein RqcH, partial [Halobacteriales archaeon]|nr:ribosome rescue protein RqcH [Halobacteriales archaeon]